MPGQFAKAVRRALLAPLWFALCVLAMAGPAAAQSESSSSFLTPFPQNDTYKALVIGDWMADGLLAGLTDAMSGEQRLRLERRHRQLMSFLRNEHDQELRSFEAAIENQGINIAVVMTGIQDRVQIRAPNGRRYAVDTAEWRQEFGRRVDAFMKAMRRRNISVYWVGLPTVRRADMNAEVEVINEVLRERSTANAIRYVDIFTETADESGEYNAYGPDITGKNRLLRESDGIHFTPTGSRKLAFFVERELKRDIAQARVERTVPLAGAEAEQRRINPTPVKAAGPAATAGKPAAKDAKSAAAGAQARATPPDNGDQRADNSRVTVKAVGAGGREEQITLEIIRPAIPASVIQLVTRRDTGSSASPVGDTLTDTLTNGLMVMRSITPTGDSAGNRGARPSPTQLPFFRVIFKGERPTPRPGRADDHRWPREDDVPPPEPVARSEPAPAPTRPPPKGAPRVSR